MPSILASATAKTSNTLTASLVVDLTLEARLAAKIALAAATRCLGDDFVDTPLADALRAIVDGNQALIEPAKKLEPVLEVAKITSTPDDRQCVLLGLPADSYAPARTIVCVRMFGRTLPAGSVLVVHAPCPQPLVLLHEPREGEVECLDAYVARHLKLGES